MRSVKLFFYSMQIMVHAVRGINDKGYIAIDEFSFIGTDECEFYPPQAKPADPTTTPAPTEPPNGIKSLSI